jgi:hypothetical protein
MSETQQQPIVKGGFPVTLLDRRFRIPGIFSFVLVIEDRRPDLDSEIDRDKIRELGYKYKHIVDIKLLWFSFYAIFRTIYPTYIRVNGKH